MDNKGSANLGDMFNRKVLTHGRIMVNQLAILIKVAHMHDLANVAVVKAAESLADTLRSFLEAQASFSLILIGDYFFIEDNRVKYNVEDFTNFEFLAGEFKKRKLGALNFGTGLEAAELIAFASAFLGVDTSSEEVYQEMVRRLVGSGVAGLGTDELKPPKADEGFEKVVDSVAAARKSYVRLVLRVKDLLTGIDHGQPADIRKLKRSVQSMVDSVYKAWPTLMRLSAIRGEEDILPRHYANVCVLSLGLGRHLGLSKYQLARLGIAAVLHDIGRHGLPEDVLERALDMDDAALEIIKRHPRLGVETLLRLKGLNEVAVSAMIVAYEHHRNLDGTGYPEQLEEKEMSLFSRIVRITDNYDATTSSGIYGKVPIPPDKALELMRNRAGQYFDQELLGLFERTMGLYPVGTLLLLTDGSLAVVCAPGRGAEGLARPQVVVIHADGDTVGEVVDLTEAGGPGGYRRDVSHSLDPYRHKVNVYRYLV